MELLEIYTPIQQISVIYIKTKTNSKCVLASQNLHSNARVRWIINECRSVQCASTGKQWAWDISSIINPTRQSSTWLTCSAMTMKATVGNMYTADEMNYACLVAKYLKKQRIIMEASGVFSSNHWWSRWWPRGYIIMMQWRPFSRSSYRPDGCHDYISKPAVVVISIRLLYPACP